MEWASYSFVVRGRTRRKVLMALEKPKTPSQISSELKLSTTHISRALKEFSDRNLVRCLTPEEKFGRVYELTEKGKELFSKLKETTSV
ncbi:MAG: ArsR family transcriptional regulator [Candidatus Aenigmarchaeota archaeon]|nr:ArsR family transcriptional regulator [Candidatus Aenigmarchaeota archaeon]